MSAPGISITFAPQIDAYVKNNGLDLSPEGAIILDAVLRSALRTEGNRASFVTGTDRTGTIEEALAIHTEGTPRKPKASSAPIGVGPGSNRTERSSQAMAKAAKAADLAREHGNPWSQRTLNKTRQAVVQNLDPALATQLRSTAGQ